MKHIYSIIKRLTLTALCSVMCFNIYAAADEGDILFSKYFESKGNIKGVAIYNSSNDFMYLKNLRIRIDPAAGNQNINGIEFEKRVEIPVYLAPHKELQLYSYTTEDNDVIELTQQNTDLSNWVKITGISLSGKNTIFLERQNAEGNWELIDIIGAATFDEGNKLYMRDATYLMPYNSVENDDQSTDYAYGIWLDGEGWYAAEGLSYDQVDGEGNPLVVGISTNRCLLVRNSDVINGKNAVAQNTVIQDGKSGADFVTLATEWKGKHVPKYKDNDADAHSAAEGFSTLSNAGYYLIKFYSCDGTELLNTQNVAISDNNRIPIYGGELPAREGGEGEIWTFAGWVTDPSCGANAVDPIMVYSSLPEANEDISYYAYFVNDCANRQQVTINIVDNNGNELPIDANVTAQKNGVVSCVDGNLGITASDEYSQNYKFLKWWWIDVNGDEKYTVLRDTIINLAEYGAEAQVTFNAVFVETDFGDTLTYRYYNDDKGYHATLINDEKYTGKIVIPETTVCRTTERGGELGKTYTVDSIAVKAFQFRKITDVTIPKTVVAIHHTAFQECTTVEYIEVDDENPVFQDINGIMFSKDGETLLAHPGNMGTDGGYEYVFPDHVKYLGEHAFTDCQKLTKVDLSNLTEITMVPNACFARCKVLTDIIIPSHIKRLDNCAFRDCSALANINLPEGLEELGDSAIAFSKKLEKIYLPSTLKSIGISALQCSKSTNTPLSSVYVKSLTPPTLADVIQDKSGNPIYSFRISDAEGKIYPMIYTQCGVVVDGKELVEIYKEAWSAQLKENHFDEAIVYNVNALVSETAEGDPMGTVAVVAPADCEDLTDGELVWTATATANDGAVFSHWEDLNGNTLKDLSGADWGLAIKFGNLIQDTTVKAVFVDALPVYYVQVREDGQYSTSNDQHLLKWVGVDSLIVTPEDEEFVSFGIDLDCDKISIVEYREAIESDAAFVSGNVIEPDVMVQPLFAVFEVVTYTDTIFAHSVSYAEVEKIDTISDIPCSASVLEVLNQRDDAGAFVYRHTDNCNDYENSVWYDANDVELDENVLMSKGSFHAYIKAEPIKHLIYFDGVLDSNGPYSCNEEIPFPDPKNGIDHDYQYLSGWRVAQFDGSPDCDEYSGYEFRASKGGVMTAIKITQDTKACSVVKSKYVCLHKGSESYDTIDVNINQTIPQQLSEVTPVAVNDCYEFGQWYLCSETGEKISEQIPNIIEDPDSFIHVRIDSLEIEFPVIYRVTRTNADNSQDVAIKEGTIKCSNVVCNAEGKCSYNIDSDVESAFKEQLSWNDNCDNSIEWGGADIAAELRAIKEQYAAGNRAYVDGSIKPALHTLLLYVDGEEFVRDKRKQCNADLNYIVDLQPSGQGWDERYECEYFDGWYDNADYNGDKLAEPATMGETDRTFYGRFLKRSFSIELDNDTVEALAVTEYNCDDEVSLPNALKDGYACNRLDGWKYKKAVLPGDIDNDDWQEWKAPYNMPHFNIVLRPVISKNSFTIHFFEDGEENVQKQQSVDCGSLIYDIISSTAIPTSADECKTYEEQEWKYADGSAIGISDVMPAADLNVYITPVDSKFAIRFIGNPDGGVEIVGNTSEFACDEDIEKPEVRVADCYDKNSVVWKYTIGQVSENSVWNELPATMNAVLREAAQTAGITARPETSKLKYNVNYYVNGSKEDSRSFDCNTSLVEAVDDYILNDDECNTFEGQSWTLKGEPVKQNDLLISDADLYIESTPKVFALHFEKDGVEDQSLMQRYKSGAEIESLPDLGDGYTAWSGEVSEGDAMPCHDVTLTAKSKHTITYTLVVYRNNDNVGEYNKEETVYYGDEINSLPAAKDFDGFSLKDGCYSEESWIEDTGAPVSTPIVVGNNDLYLTLRINQEVHYATFYVDADKSAIFENNRILYGCGEEVSIINSHPEAPVGKTWSCWVPSFATMGTEDIDFIPQYIDNGSSQIHYVVLSDGEEIQSWNGASQTIGLDIEIESVPSDADGCYSYGAWRDVTGKKYSGTIAMPENLTLYSIRSANEFAVTFISNPDGGVEIVGNTSEFACDEDIEKPEVRVADCYDNNSVVWKYTIGETNESSEWKTLPSTFNDELREAAQTAGITARPEASKLQFTVTFKNHDDEVLQSGLVDCGETPVYSGRTPTKPDDEQYSYTFAGWEPEIAVVSEDAVYTATFSEEEIKYVVHFIVDGEEVRGEVADGVILPREVEYNANLLDVVRCYSPESEDQCITFAGKTWTLEDGAEITPNMMVTSEVRVYIESDVRTLTATFVIDGEEYESVEFECGGSPVAPDVPAQDCKTFAWDNIAENIYSDTTVNGSYSDIFKLLTIQVTGDDVPQGVEGYAGRVQCGTELDSYLSNYPDLTGYTITWTGVPSDMLMPAEDLTITIDYRLRAAFTLTYNILDEAGEVEDSWSAPRSYYPGETAQLDAQPADEDCYTYTGWHLSNESTEVTSVTFDAANINVYSNKSEKRGGTITYTINNSGDFKISSTNVACGTKLSEVELEALPELMGAYFCSEYASENWLMPDGSALDADYVIKSGETLELHATTQTKTLTATFVIDGYNYNKEVEFECGGSPVAPADVPAQDCKTFAWDYYDAVNTTDITVFGHYSDVELAVLTIEVADDIIPEGIQSDEFNVACGEEIESYLDGYKNIEGYTDSWSNIPADGKMTADNLTLTVTYTKWNEYRVIYTIVDAQGDVIERRSSEDTYYTGAEVILDNPLAEEDCYTYSAWYVDDVNKPVRTVVINGADAIVYAQAYAKAGAVINYYVEGAEGLEIEPTQVACGTKWSDIKLADLPELDGDNRCLEYTSENWLMPDGSALDADYVIKSGETLELHATTQTKILTASFVIDGEEYESVEFECGGRPEAPEVDTELCRTFAWEEYADYLYDNITVNGSYSDFVPTLTIQVAGDVPDGKEPFADEIGCGEDISEWLAPYEQDIFGYTYRWENVPEGKLMPSEDWTITIYYTLGEIVVPEIEEYSICAGEEFCWNTRIYTEDGYYPVHLVDAAGVHSVKILHLTVNPTYERDTTLVVCTLPFQLGDNMIEKEGLTVLNLKTKAGCDSIVNVNLIYFDGENPIERYDSICESELKNEGYVHTSPYSDDKYTYNEAGDHRAAFTTTDGNCEYVELLHLVAMPEFSVDTTVIECGSFELNGETFNTSGDYTQNLQTWFGCDSVINLHLTIINAGDEVEISDQVCPAGLPYNRTAYVLNEAGERVLKTFTYDKAGDYTETVATLSGCEYRETLHLSVFEAKDEIETVKACDTYTWDVTGKEYTESTTVSETYTTDDGCTYTKTLVLTINKSVTEEIEVTACESYTWKLSGSTYTESGDYEYVSETQTGCTSTTILHLTITKPANARIEVQQACDSYVWERDGKEYTESGTYTYLDKDNCTNYTLDLTVNKSEKTDEYVETCESYEYEGTVYTESGDYTIMSQTESGCDKEITLHLTVNKPTSSRQIFYLCPGETVEVNDNIYSYADLGGPYVEVAKNAAGCDSTITFYIFETDFSLIAKPNRDGWGTVTVEQYPTCDNGNIAIVSAQPADGYHFSQWNGGAQDNPYSFKVECDTVVVANFFEAQPQVDVYTITTGTTNTVLGWTNAWLELEAKANPGYVFLYWDTDLELANAEASYQQITLADEYFISAEAVFGVDENSGLTIEGGKTHGLVTDIENENIKNSIIAQDGKITVIGYEGKSMQVYSVVGHLLYDGKINADKTEVYVPAHTVYLVKIGDKTAKIVMK